MGDVPRVKETIRKPRIVRSGFLKINQDGYRVDLVVDPHDMLTLIKG